MCIAHSVGQGGTNAPKDVRSIQILLNLNRDRAGFQHDLSVDGLWGPASETALTSFLKAIGVSSMAISPGTPALQALHTPRLDSLNETSLWLSIPDSTPNLVSRFLAPIQTTLEHYQIDTPLRSAHFLAQIAHESGALRDTKEIADGTAYEGRRDLGNTEPGDGPRFKGRGLIQLTGRANYRSYGKACGRDLEANPDQVADDPVLAADVAGWYWANHKLNALADSDDLEEITHRINGGLNGLAQRGDYLNRAKWVLSA